jgi:hypothetical protein
MVSGGTIGGHEGKRKESQELDQNIRGLSRAR